MTCHTAIHASAAAPRIEHEGLVWTLDQFCDAHHFIRFDDTVPAVHGANGPLWLVTRDGQLREAYPEQIVWGDVLAYRAPDLSSWFGSCDHCGGVTTIQRWWYSDKEGMVAEECCTDEYCPFFGDDGLLS